MASTTINQNLAKARSQATFDPAKLTNFIHGGPGKSDRKKFIQNIAIKELQKENFKKYSETSREERYDEAMRKTIFYQKKCHELNLTTFMDKAWFASVVFPSEMSPFDLHTGMFLQTIHKLCTEEQKNKWLPLAESFEILGTYAQTELGHGTFLRGLETVATYDTSRKDFIIDSPTITSTKFWPGALGKTSNYCIVMAKLFIDGRDCGMQSFFVQLRDLETHRPMPGITVGDIGTKFGYNGMDNGFLRLNKVHVPRENMLMRYAQVSEDGIFSQAKNDRVMYGTMTWVRAQIAINVGHVLSKAVTIATRYSAVRFQSEINAGMGEVAVIDFQTQQYKVFVQIATTYALTMSGRRVVSLYDMVSSQIDKGNFEQMPLLHAVSSGQKAFSTWAMVHGIEQCRFACGGHGYLQASGLPKMYMNENPACTYEGENTVLTLQTARFLNKCFEAALKGGNVPSAMRFLTKTFGKSKLTTNLEPDHLITAYEYRAAVLLQEANKRMKVFLNKGMKPAEAWNNSSQALVEAATAFSHAYVVRAFIESIQQSNLEPSLAVVMTQLYQLYAAHGITKDAGQFAKGGFMSAAQLAMVQSKVYDLLADIKPNAVALVDAFDLPDEVLDSALGRYDGNVYEALMETARRSRLNETEVHEGIFKYVKPYVKYLKAQKEVQSRL